LLHALSSLLVRLGHTGWSRYVCSWVYIDLPTKVGSLQVLFANRFNVYSTLIIFSYPFFSIGVATLVFAFGTHAFLSRRSHLDLITLVGGLSTMWSSDDRGVQGCSVLVLLPPISMGILFVVSCVTAKHGTPLRKDSVDSDVVHVE
jgi:hypothetical protein